MKHTTDKEVLLINQGSESCRNLAFLLKLAGYRYRLVTDLMEGINHIFNCQFNHHPLDLIIVDEQILTAGDSRGATFLRELIQGTALLFIEGGDAGNPVARKIFAANISNTFFVSAEKAMEEVKRILQNNETDVLYELANEENSDIVSPPVR